jgi:hypothetical protein
LLYCVIAKGLGPGLGNKGEEKIALNPYPSSIDVYFDGFADDSGKICGCKTRTAH